MHVTLETNVVSTSSFTKEDLDQMLVEGLLHDPADTYRVLAYALQAGHDESTLVTPEQFSLAEIPCAIHVDLML